MTAFTITSDRWYGSQMNPGYTGERFAPYCSPIFVTGIQPLHSGQGILKVDFLYVLYAAGVQDFSVKLRVLNRAQNYLLGDMAELGDSIGDRCALISHIEMDWIKRFCPEMWFHRPPSSCSPAAQGSVDGYLNELFFRCARGRGDLGAGI